MFNIIALVVVTAIVAYALYKILKKHFAEQKARADELARIQARLAEKENAAGADEQ